MSMDGGAEGQPALTVVIPVWESPYVEYLPRAVASVKTGVDAPVVIVDNASSVEIPQLPGTLVVRTERRLTAGAARNLGLASVATEFVLFLDADDELVDGALPALHAGIADDPGVDAFVMSVLDAESHERHRFPHRWAHHVARLPRLFALATTTWSLFPTQGAAILRAGRVRDAGGYADANHGEDWALAASLAFRGRVVFDPRPARIYHRHPGSLLVGGALGARDVLAAGRTVRAHLRAQPGLSLWSRALLPITAVFQLMLVGLVRPAYLLAGRLRKPSG